MKAQNPQSTKKITCPYDPDEPKAIFEISTSIPVGLRNKFQDVFMEVATRLRNEEDVKFSELYSHNRELVRVGLKGVENVYDGKGAALSITGAVTDQLLDVLSEIRLVEAKFDNLINWLGAEIWKANTLSEEEKKT